MAVAKQNITVYQGADYRQSIEIRDESSVLMDLTGYVFRGQARTDFSAAKVLDFVFTLRDQDTETGVVDMAINADDTTALNISKRTSYIYDIEMVTNLGRVYRIVEGRMDLQPEVTK